MELGVRNSRTNPLYRKVYKQWYTVNRRCYNPKCKDYKNYGAKGVTVCDEWRNFEGFAKTIDKVKGFCLEKYLSNEIVLDKDGPNLTNKVYSPDLCEFITKAESNRRIPSTMKEFYSYKDGILLGKFRNKVAYGAENGMSSQVINYCIKNKTSHKGFRFSYEKL